MRDWIKRISIIAVYGVFVRYLLFLYSNGAVIVQGEYLHLNGLFYALLFAFALYKFVFYGVYPVIIRFSKPTLFVLALLLLFVGQYVLHDDAAQFVYIADLVKVLGVVLLVLAPTNILHTKKNIKEKKMKEVEIIEV